MPRLFSTRTLFPGTAAIIVLALVSLPALALGDESDPPVPGKAEKNEALPSLSEEVREKLKFPGLSINFEERSVDIESTVCLEAGLLELIACTKGTKEHESIVAIEAQPMHVHTALLLLRAKPGNPAMSKATDPKRTRWVHLPPRGGKVNVSLAFDDGKGKAVERPISDFIKPAGEEYGEGPATGSAEAVKPKGFPTHTFLFAGSILADGKPGQARRYLADQTGNLITLSTFGDETLCLPEIHSHENGALMWAVDSTHLPAAGTGITLRLRPVITPVTKKGEPSKRAPQSEIESTTPDQ